MLKYINYGIVFQEIPDEVTLSINISNCPCRCPGCHSTYLWQDTGTALTPVVREKFIREYGNDITCICFMGGDAEPEYVNVLASFMHREYPQYKIAWYSGRPRISSKIRKTDFDDLGCLKKHTTNQRLYKRVSGEDFTDITYRFWR